MNKSGTPWAIFIWTVGVFSAILSGVFWYIRSVSVDTQDIKTDVAVIKNDIATIKDSIKSSRVASEEQYQALMRLTNGGTRSQGL